jgi:hypothetical protein
MGFTVEREWKQWLAQDDNKNMVTAEVSKWVENSKFIYRGQIGDNTTKVFRIYDNIVLVLDSQETCIITMFKCSFDFGEDMDRIIIAHEIDTINDLHKELAVIDADISEFVEKKQVEISTIDQTIKALEAQIASLRVQKGAAEESVKGKKSTREFNTREIEKRAVRICNSIEYRKDLNSNAS